MMGKKCEKKREVMRRSAQKKNNMQRFRERERESERERERVRERESN